MFSKEEALNTFRNQLEGQTLNDLKIALYSQKDIFGNSKPTYQHQFTGRLCYYVCLNCAKEWCRAHNIFFEGLTDENCQFMLGTMPNSCFKSENLKQHLETTHNIEERACSVFHYFHCVFFQWVLRRQPEKKSQVIKTLIMKRRKDPIQVVDKERGHSKERINLMEQGIHTACQDQIGQSSPKRSEVKKGSSMGQNEKNISGEKYVRCGEKNLESKTISKDYKKKYDPLRLMTIHQQNRQLFRNTFAARTEMKLKEWLGRS